MEAGRLLAIACGGALWLGSCAADADDIRHAHMPLVGGEETTDFEAVGYLLTTAGDGTKTACSSALIAPSIVLTAAHCVDGKPGGTEAIEVYFGTIHGEGDPGSIATISAQSWQVFDPNWSFEGDDIALVHLDGDVDVEPLAFNRTILSSEDVGRTLTLVGWGRTSADVANAGTKRVAVASIRGLESDEVLNYGSQEANQCYGDSGGPGLIEVDGELVIASVASWESGECLGQSGGTRVAAYAAWLDAVIAGDELAPPAFTIVEPTEDAIVEPGFSVELTIDSMAAGLDKIEIYAGDRLLVSDSELTPPFRYEMPGVLPVGETELLIRVRDEVASVTEETRRVTIALPGDEPKEPGDEEGGCSAGPSRAPGVGVWLVALIVLRSRRRRRGGA